MSKHEFYADPTLFDYWQSAASELLRTMCSRIGPYSWVAGFATLGALLGAISLVLLGISLPITVAGVDVAWNQSLARGITAIVALVTAQWLFRQALGAWPHDVKLPALLLGLSRYVDWKPAVVRPSREHRTVRQPASAVDRAEVQAFFAGVKAAGVNVAIARALLAAGIQSPRQLRVASDRQLTAIRGVGPVSVRKLRAWFGQADHPALQVSDTR